NPEPEIETMRADEKLADEQKDARELELREQWQHLHNKVVEVGGLHIVGTERHESRRVDNQLRGRAGRQGDPGSTRFYLSLEDPLLRIFASDRVAAIMDRLKLPEGEAIEHPWVTRAIENAQRKVEARNFDIRKQLLEYDDVANDQRKVIYHQRNELLESSDVTETLRSMREGAIEAIIEEYVPAESVEEQWDIPGLEKVLASEFSLDLKLTEWLEQDKQLDESLLRHRVVEAAHLHYDEKVKDVPEETMRHYERAIMLQSLDSHWREHLSSLDQLRQGIHLRGYAQKNPKQEYKREAFELFSLMLEEIRNDVTRVLMTVRIRNAEDADEAAEERTGMTNVRYQHAEYDDALRNDQANANETEKAKPFVRPGEKIGRNDPCPCGSGKKYKHCHGRLS
ncbi:MAG: SEC-C metal-binding domain-containing protein, partial [Burkholderiales bacterium]